MLPPEMLIRINDPDLQESTTEETENEVVD